ncbi:hypothetical protein EDD86DRAFT_209413 [Gorgonomyces haynaldii]|nr:hypothetical protein EDD86DRAFT_209413 [Gorgonomyces haynaldii]
MSFDWYVSPADKFQYENEFNKHSKNDVVTLQDMDPVFHNSRLQESEFLQSWQLIDIRFENQLNQTQFVYLMHVLNSRRRGKQIPSGLPLDIKEQFLKETVERPLYVRQSTNVRDVGQSMNKSQQELEKENEQLDLDISAAEKDLKLAEEYLRDMESSEEEMDGLHEYYTRLLQYLSSNVDTSALQTRQLEQDVLVLHQMAQQP